MLGNLRKLATGGASSVWKKFLTLTVAAGLAASMTLGATPVSATTASWEDWALEVDNTAPLWGDVVEFSAEIDWTTCKRIPIVYLLGTSDNGDPISVRLTGDQVTGKIYSYSISYGGVDEDGVDEGGAQVVSGAQFDTLKMTGEVFVTFPYDCCYVLK